MQKKTEQEIKQRVKKYAVEYLKDVEIPWAIYHTDDDQFFTELPVCRAEDKFTEDELISLGNPNPRVPFFHLLHKRYRNAADNLIHNIARDFTTAHPDEDMDLDGNIELQAIL